LSKNSDFNHLKIIFAQKTQKSQNKIKKISKGQKSRKHVGTCWRQIKPQEAMRQYKDEFYCNDPKPLCKDHHCFGVFLKLFLVVVFRQTVC
jgi:hypothetical protein